MAVATGSATGASATGASATGAARATTTRGATTARGRASRSSSGRRRAPLWPAAAPGLQAAGRACALVRQPLPLLPGIGQQLPAL